MMDYKDEYKAQLRVVELLRTKLLGDKNLYEKQHTHSFDDYELKRGRLQVINDTLNFLEGVETGIKKLLI
jgi:hypothetical protein